jgi:hypothetical protein
MPRIAESAEIKKRMTKLVACTKQYRKAVRQSAKIGHQYRKLTRKNLRGKETKEEKKIRKRMTTLSNKTQTVHRKCEDIANQLDDMKGLVRKEATKTKIERLFHRLDENDTEWASNTDSYVKALHSTGSSSM